MAENDNNPTSVVRFVAPLAVGTSQALCCPRCKEEIGQFTDTVLYIGKVHFVRPEIFYCNACSIRIRWRPLPQGA